MQQIYWWNLMVEMLKNVKKQTNESTGITKGKHFEVKN